VNRFTAGGALPAFRRRAELLGGNTMKLPRWLAVRQTKSDLWNIDHAKAISELRCHSEGMAVRWRIAAICFAVIAVVMFIVVGIWAIFFERPFDERATASVAWAVARVSVGILLAALVLFFSRVVWSYSNVWLGRAGTLEDLTLALKLLGVTPSEKLGSGQSAQLRDIAESFERLRRGFEGDLLKVPSFEVKIPASKGG
jgi:hypothetical protein